MVVVVPRTSHCDVVARRRFERSGSRRRSGRRCRRSLRGVRSRLRRSNGHWRCGGIVVVVVIMLLPRHHVGSVAGRFQFHLERVGGREGAQRRQRGKERVPHERLVTVVNVEGVECLLVSRLRREGQVVENGARRPRECAVRTEATDGARRAEPAERGKVRGGG